MLGSGFMDRDIHGREMRLWQTLGPTGYRLLCVGLAALLAAEGVTVFLAGMTAVSLFPGTGAVYQGPGENVVQVVSGECNGLGTISRRGLVMVGVRRSCHCGRWRCPEYTDWPVGRHARGPGSSVELREGCRDKEKFTHCSYGRPTSSWFEVSVLFIGKMGWLGRVVGGLGV